MLISLLGTLISTLALGGDVGLSKLSPDGSRVVFGEGPNVGSHELFSAPSDGSLLPVPLSGPMVAFGSLIDAEFTPDGARVVYAADQAVSFVVELFSVPSAGGSAPTRLNAPLFSNRSVQLVSGHWFRTTPDGARVLYVADQLAYQRFDLFSVPVDGSAAPVHLSVGLTPGADVKALELSPDGTQAVFVANGPVFSVLEAYAVPVDGSAAPTLLSTLGGSVAKIAISPDSARVVYTAPEVFSVPLDGSAAPIQLGGGAGVPVGFTPDSLSVVHSAGSQLVSAPLDGSTPLVLATNVSDSIQVSPDGEWCLYRSVGFKVENLYSVRVDGSAPPVRLARPGMLGLFRVSPDSRWVAYTTGDLTHPLRVVPIDGSAAPTLLSTENVTAFRFVPGTTRLVFSTNDFFPAQAQLFQVGLGLALAPAPLGPGDIRDLGANRGKRTVSSVPRGAPTRTGVLLHTVTLENGEELLLAGPWDGSQAAVLLNP